MKALLVDMYIVEEMDCKGPSSEIQLETGEKYKRQPGYAIINGEKVIIFESCSFYRHKNK
jgi:hypothetical protein